MNALKTEADVIVVGSGAGGGAIARELSEKGLEVLILEKGAYHRRFFGTHLAAGLMADKAGFLYSREGLQVLRGLTVGGSTMFTCGTYRQPASFIKHKLGIDLSTEIEETRQDIGIKKLPDKYLEGSSLMLLEAANKMGYQWEIFEKLIDEEKCRERCSDCMLVCPRGAKWTSRRYLEEAVSHGATLVPRTSVHSVIESNGQAVGVKARVAGKRTDFRAPLVIVAAGGIGSSPILNRSGIKEAGQGIFVDPLVVVSGAYKGKLPYAATRWNPPMSVGTWEFQDQGFMLAPLIDPWALYAWGMTLVSAAKMLRVLRYRRIMGIMVKIKDDLGGELLPDGTFSKPLTVADQRKLDTGAGISEEILIKAGCSRKSLVTSLTRGAHPGGACPIGRVLTKDLETHQIKNLYVSDASIFPEALGTPVVATVVAMNKRLARHIMARRQAKSQAAQEADRPAQMEASG